MASLEEIRTIRLHKLELLKKAGMEAYPAKVPRDFDLAQAKKHFADYEKDGAGKHAGKVVSLTGRIMAIRGQGAILFVVLDDGSDRLQAVFKKDEFGVGAIVNEKFGDLFKLFGEVADIGDFISVTGSLFKTQRGEESILVTSWTMVSKSLLPLPEKWHGLTDIDERFRKRYLDFIMNPELRELFVKKAKFWDVTRTFLKDRGFLEVETPTLEVTTGGAEATPFKTHHNDFDLPVYMRISIGELWQKRLMAAGFQKTFEIGRAYRNEGSSPEHAQEFTNMEFYWSYADYHDGMKLVADLYRTLAKEVFGTTKFATHGHTFDLADEWTPIDYTGEIKKQTGLDITHATEKEMKAKLDELHVKYEGENRERLTDTLWKYCRKNIAGPAFLVNHPALVAPLAKSVIGKNGTPEPVVQMFQPIIAGSEVGRGYSELNDPIDQAQRFALQEKLIKSGDTEAMMPDHEFVEMLEHAMPPACGFGFGERLFAFFADKTLREVQMCRVSLSDRMDTPAGELSRGLRQRLAIGQTMVHEPRVLLLDEPAAGLDPQARRDLSSLLVSLKDAGMTLVVSSHILAELEDYCSEMIIIEGGRIAGGKAVKVRDVERPRYLLEVATARSDLRDFLTGRAGLDVIEVDEHHALFTFTRNPGARAKLIRDMVTAGFELSSFGESTKALEDTYFAQVGKS